MSKSRIASPSIILNREMMDGRGGCMCKMPGSLLRNLLAGAQIIDDLADYRPQDCARIPAGTFDSDLLVTTDVNYVVGRDLFQAGIVSALHAMSDVYAMGGKPVFALVHLVADQNQPLAHAENLLAGVHQACQEEGVHIIGGHSTIGTEAMVGLTILAHPPQGRTLEKKGARPGDAILISKPVGTGMVLRAYKLGIVDDSALEEAMRLMSISNRAASHAALAAEAHAATDVSGFGLLGHLSEMLNNDQLDEPLGTHISLAGIPIINYAQDLPRICYDTTWVRGNLEYTEALQTIEGNTGLNEIYPLLDPQTNGGLMIMVDPSHVETATSNGFTLIGFVDSSGTITIKE